MQKNIELLNILWFYSISCILQNSNNTTAFSCEKGYFEPSKGNCIELLSCKEMPTELEFIQDLDGGYVKRMSLVEWKSMKLVYSIPRTSIYVDDFLHGMKMMESFQGSKYLLQIVGLCYEPKQILTTYYKHGSANNLQSIILNEGMNDVMEAKIRLQLSLDYLEIIEFLHNSPIGCRVMCDSNSLEKTMSQFLISDDFHLVLADVDALPEVKRNSSTLVKCGHRELSGSFVAPEQQWPFEDLDFDDSKMPGYDEKTDIWKIPDVIYFLLGNTIISERMKFMFFDQLKKCKSFLPKDRPDAKDLVNEFKSHRREIVKDLLEFHSNDEL